MYAPDYNFLTHFKEGYTICLNIYIHYVCRMSMTYIKKGEVRKWKKKIQFQKFLKTRITDYCWSSNVKMFLNLKIVMSYIPINSSVGFFKQRGCSPQSGISEMLRPHCVTASGVELPKNRISCMKSLFLWMKIPMRVCLNVHSRYFFYYYYFLGTNFSLPYNHITT